MAERTGVDDLGTLMGGLPGAVCATMVDSEGDLLGVEGSDLLGQMGDGGGVLFHLVWVHLVWVDLCDIV